MISRTSRGASDACCSAADNLPAAAHNGRRVRLGRAGTEQGFLGTAARLGKHAVLGRVESSRSGQAGFDELGKRQVHVIAAQQQMFADGLTHEAEFALLLDGANEAEIAGTAADVHNQATRTRFEQRGLLGRVGCQPAVERGLRFFQKGQVFNTCLAGSVHGQVARHIVERSRHGEHDPLFFQAVLRPVRGHAKIPALDHVLKVARRGFDRRNARHVRAARSRAGSPRSDRPRHGTATISPRSPVDRGMCAP